MLCYELRMRSNRRTATYAALLAFAAVVGGVANGATLTNMEWTIDGATRRALVHLPARTDGAPIIFAFHGHGGR